jgi:hypothetical protein
MHFFVMSVELIQQIRAQIGGVHFLLLLPALLQGSKKYSLRQEDSNIP